MGNQKRPNPAVSAAGASVGDSNATAIEAMAAIGRARISGGGGLRQQRLAAAQQHIARLNPIRHRTLVQQLQGHVLALQGRGSDTKIAHVTPGEIVIPKRLQNPALMAALAQAAVRTGIDPATLQVGARRAKINPRTGHQEFDDGDPGQRPAVWPSPEYL